MEFDLRLTDFGKYVFFVTDGVERFSGKVLERPVDRTLPAAVFAIEEQVFSVNGKVEIAVKELIIGKPDP
jgi:hypothetical protein